MKRVTISPTHNLERLLETTIDSNLLIKIKKYHNG